MDMSNATTQTGAQAVAAKIFTPLDGYDRRSDHYRRFAIQSAWDLRRASQRPGRDREYDDEIAAIHGFYVHDRDYNDEQWAYLVEAAARHDAKVLKQREEKAASAKAAAAAAAPTRNDFIRALFANTEGPTFVCSYPNERDDKAQAGPRQIIGRKSAAITNFLTKWDKPGRGAFICIGTLKEGAQRRAKENIAETPCPACRHRLQGCRHARRGANQVRAAPARMAQVPAEHHRVLGWRHPCLLAVQGAG